MRPNTLKSPSFIARILIGVTALFLAATMAIGQESGAGQPAPIIAVGDVHGDYDAYMSVLQAAGLINEKGKWSGGNTRFVQVGDIPDRGAGTDKILEHLMKLERQAKRKGGEVVALIGNHEAMNMTGDLRYVDPREYAALKNSKSKRLRTAWYNANREHFGEVYRRGNPDLTDEQVRAAFDEDYPLGYAEHRQAWAPDGKFGEWVSSHDALRVVGDTLFMHAGISAEYVTMPIDEINKQVRAAVRGEIPDTILTGATSPLWYRGFASETETGQADVEAALQAYGVKRIVIGHTPQPSGIKSLYGGKVILIDTGMSAHYGGTKSFLRIDGDRISVTDNGVTTDW